MSEQMKRIFTHTTEAYYYPAVELIGRAVDEVYFGTQSIRNGFYDGSVGEMRMSWHDLGGKTVPRLEIFDDAWGLLPDYLDLIAALSKLNDRNITAIEFCDLLKHLGFEDVTQRDRPDSADAARQPDASSKGGEEHE